MRFDRAQRHSQRFGDLAVALGLEIGHADQARLHRRQLIDALAQPGLVSELLGAAALDHVCCRCVLHRGLHLHPAALMPYPVDMQVARDAVQPGTQRCLRRVVAGCAQPQPQQALLRELLGHCLGRTQTAQVDTQARHEMIVDAHEAVAVAQPRHTVHVTGPVRRLAARLLGTGHDAYAIEVEGGAGGVRVHLRSRRAGEGLFSLRLGAPFGCSQRRASSQPSAP